MRMEKGTGAACGISPELRNPLLEVSERIDLPKGVTP